MFAMFLSNFPNHNLDLKLDHFEGILRLVPDLFGIILRLISNTKPLSSELADEITSEDFYYDLFLKAIDQKSTLLFDIYTSELDPYLLDIIKYNHSSVNVSNKLTGDLIDKIEDPQTIDDLLEYLLINFPKLSHLINYLEKRQKELNKGNPTFWYELVLNSNNPINLRLHAAQYIIENLDPDIPEFLDALASSNNSQLEEIVLDQIRDKVDDNEVYYRFLLNSSNIETKKKTLEALKDFIFHPHRDKVYSKFEKEIIEKYFRNQKLSFRLFKLGNQIFGNI